MKTFTKARIFLDDRIPLWVRQTAVLVGIYFVVMLALAHWLSAWHDWDWRFFDWLKPSPTALSSQIAIVDMNYSDPDDIPQHRAILSTFITQAARQQPLAIILDIPFGQTCLPQYCAQMSSSRQQLMSAIKSATTRTNVVRVFANVGDMKLTPDGFPDGAPPPLDSTIYAVVSGYGHTDAVVMGANKSDAPSGDLFYRTCYPHYPALLGSHMPQDVWALVDVVLYRDEVLGPVAGRSRVCDPTEPIAVRYGPLLTKAEQYQISASSPFPHGASFAGKYVIVGVPAFDPHTATTSHPGLDLLAWIFDDELTYRQFFRTAVQPQGAILPFLVLGFSAFTALAFVAWFYLLKQLPLAGMRRFLPWIAAAVALCFGAGALIAFEAWMLKSAHQIQPQIALISMGLAVAAGLSGVRGSQIEFELLNRIDYSAKPEENDYDVFVSYAHEELAWVLEHVYLPLQNAKVQDGSENGRKLKIFFDTESIRVGTAWQDKISHAIAGSKFIVPVFSEIYFRRPYCRFEIKRAHRKWIGEGEESRCVLPVMRGHPKIMDTVDDFQAKSIDDEPDIVERIIAEIIERLSRR